MDLHRGRRESSKAGRASVGCVLQHNAIHQPYVVWNDKDKGGGPKQGDGVQWQRTSNKRHGSIGDAGTNWMGAGGESLERRGYHTCGSKVEGKTEVVNSGSRWGEKMRSTRKVRDNGERPYQHSNAS